eukprot:TRINITY_DN15570_c0_g1_i4.p1 TRINITY_DN15570_c0_g1~~TRINITY_DN15570_c0_g1_i4.p1  ORF type:complete len:772 (-),score=135.79 TRINITY_DN15570_c0_g1_i4:655-2970(-)
MTSGPFQCGGRAGCSRAEWKALLEPTEEVIATIAADALLEGDGDSMATFKRVDATSAALVRSRTRQSEAALLLAGSSAGFGGLGILGGRRVVAAVPFCDNIVIELGPYGTSSSSRSHRRVSKGCCDWTSTADVSSELVPLNRPEVIPPSAAGGKGLPTGASANPPGTAKVMLQFSEEEHADKVESFTALLDALRVLAAKRRYTFASAAYNHDWLWSYGEDCVPTALRKSWGSPLAATGSGSSSQDTTSQQPAKRSILYGGVTLQRVIGSLAPGKSLQAVLRAHAGEFSGKVPLNIAVVTLNCGGGMPPQDAQSQRSLQRMFAQQAAEQAPAAATDKAGAAAVSAPQIWMVALQETCPLVFAVDVTDTVTSRHHAAWREAICSAIHGCPTHPEAATASDAIAAGCGADAKAPSSATVDGYELLIDRQLVGLQLLIFVEKSLLPHVSNICTGTVRCGALGVGGNKGAVAASFNIHASSVCFVDCHLAAGEANGNAADRQRDFHSIVETLRLEEACGSASPAASAGGDASPGRDFRGQAVDPKSPIRRDANLSWTANAMVHEAMAGSGRNIFEHDIVVWAGDFNSRLWANEYMREPVDKSILKEALEDKSRLEAFAEKHDELCMQRNKPDAGLLTAFSEARLTFAPTYKLKGSIDKANPDHADLTIEDYSQKRLPAFCDRVLWRARDGVAAEAMKYESVSSARISDHLPVRLLLQVVVNEVKWDALTELIIQELQKDGTVDTSRRASSMDVTSFFSAVRRDSSFYEPAGANSNC